MVVRDRGDLAVVRRAIRAGWQLPEQLLAVLPSQIAAIFLDRDASRRDRLAAAKLLMEMHSQNCEDDGQGVPKDDVIEMTPLAELTITEENFERLKGIGRERIKRIAARRVN